MNISFLILGYGIGVFLGCVFFLWIPDAFREIKYQIKEYRRRKEAKIRWEARLKEYKANDGWLPIDE